MISFGKSGSTVSSSGGLNSADLDSSAMSISSQEGDANSSAITLDIQEDLGVDEGNAEMEVVVFRNLPLKLINCVR